MLSDVSDLFLGNFSLDPVLVGSLFKLSFSLGDPLLRLLNFITLKLLQLSQLLLLLVLLLLDLLLEQDNFGSQANLQVLASELVVL